MKPRTAKTPPPPWVDSRRETQADDDEAVEPDEVLLRIENHLGKNRERLIDFFRGLDDDNSGGVSLKELRRGLRDRNISCSNREERLLMTLLDPNGDGEIEYNELVAARKGLAMQHDKIFASTSISTSTRNVNLAPPEKQTAALTEAMKTLTTLDKKIRQENPSYKSPIVPKPRPQLPIGGRSEAVLSVRNAKHVPFWAQPKPEEVLAQEDQERLQKRQSARVVDQWASKKKELEKVQKLTQQKQLQAQHVMVSNFINSRAEASKKKFKDWCARKEKEKASRVSNSQKKASVFSGRVNIDEFIAAIYRVPSTNSDMLEIFEELLPKLDERRRVLPSKFYSILEQVELETQVQIAHQHAEEEKAAQDAIPLAEVSKEERLERQRSSVLQRIGEQILNRHAQSKRSAVRLIGRINDALGRYDQVEPGCIKEADFRQCVKELELGISAGQQVDLCKSCGSKGAATIDIRHLEAFLIQAMGKMRLHTSSPPCTGEFTAMTELCDVLGLHDARVAFEDILMEALTYRDEVNSGKTGWISTKKLLHDLLATHEGDRLSLSKRKDLISIIATYCKQIDRHNDGMIESSRIVVFLRMVELTIHKKQMQNEIPRDERRQQDTRYRLFRVILAAAEREGIQFPTLQKQFADGLKPIATVRDPNPESDSRQLLSVASFVSLMRRMRVGLSMVQVEELAKVCNVTGRGIDPGHMQQWLIDSHEKEQALKHAKSDPRTSLCEDMVRVMGATVFVQLPAILDRYLDLILGTNRDTPSEDPLLASSASIAGAAVKIKRQNNNSFDVSWGRDARGNPISMPPGKVTTREDIKMSKGSIDPNESENSSDWRPLSAPRRRGSTASHFSGMSTGSRS